LHRKMPYDTPIVQMRNQKQIIKEESDVS